MADLAVRTLETSLASATVAVLVFAFAPLASTASFASLNACTPRHSIDIRSLSSIRLCLQSSAFLKDVLTCIHLKCFHIATKPMQRKRQRNAVRVNKSSGMPSLIEHLCRCRGGEGLSRRRHLLEAALQPSLPPGKILPLPPLKLNPCLGLPLSKIGDPTSKSV